jgi:hypothetical protein
VKSQNIVPVMVSITVIILVAVLQRHSKLAAAITATMPLSMPLALWIVYASAGGDRGTTAQFSRGMLIAMVPTIGFVVAVWLAARAGMKLVPMLLLGYGVWGIMLALVVALRRGLGL